LTRKKDNAGKKVETSPSSATSSESFYYEPGESVGYLLRDCYRSFSKQLEKKIGEYDIKIGQWFFLRELWEDDGLSQRELARRTGMMESTTVVAIRGMIKADLVQRAHDPFDKRRYFVRLTAKGRRLRDKLLPYAREVNEKATVGLSASEIKKFRSVLKTLKKNLRSSE
jgi:MarR family transcriptional regulator, organic hydroperoxide resistance regulator